MTNGGESAAFSKATIDALKRLDLIEPIGSDYGVEVEKSVRVFYYRPKRQKRGNW